MRKKTAPFGSWPSPVSFDWLAGQTVRLKDVQITDEGGMWLESRAWEGGRHVVMEWKDGAAACDRVPAPFDVRTRVHEYGGGSFLAVGDCIYFTHFADQRLYRCARGEAPVALTPEGTKRYADLAWDGPRQRLIAVVEEHVPGEKEPRNYLAAIPARGGDARPIARGHDFFSNPRLSPDGTTLAWLTWDHPRMPWDGTDLWVARFAADGGLEPPRHVAGGASESIFQPEWSPDGTLHFVSDRTGFWNLYAHRDERAVALCPMEAEMGMPGWVFGMSTYGFTPDGHIVVAYCQNGRWRLGRIGAGGNGLEPFALDFEDIDYVRVRGDRCVMLAGSPRQPLSVVSLDLKTGTARIVKSPFEPAALASHVSTPESLAYPSENGATAYAFYYPPFHPEYEGVAGEKPPLLVISHGGPTAATATTLSLEIQFWTTRGFGVLDVNYGGSTGYGRRYRERLNGQWGIVDVDDCTRGALFLAARGDVDRKRLAIRGGSAGGYTTLAALTFRDVFSAGASYYGVSDIEALMQDTHKFESRYDSSLVGPLPEARRLYRERSPIHFVDRLGCPLILLQGLEDKVVPPNQAEKMFQALKAKGIPVAYLAFPGEQHGFRRSENIRRALEAELYFYSRVFGFEPGEALQPVTIENDPARRA